MALSIRRWITHIGIKWIIMMIWAIVCILLFKWTYSLYKYEPSFYYVHQMLGSWLCISRAAASVINLNCGLILLPMCRTVMTACRGLQRKMSLYTMRMILDSCKGFHIACAYAIIVASVIHYIAHVFNAKNFSMNYNRIYKNVNAARYQDEDPIWIVLGTVPGATGMMMMIILCLVVTSSIKYNRENNYNLFWYSHKLVALMYILLLVHAFRGPLRKQLNIVHHTPGCKFQNMSFPWPEPEFYHSAKSYSCDEEPKFGEIGCESYVWVSVPLIIYLGDVMYRVLRRSNTAQIVGTVCHADNVIELKMIKDGFKAYPGQFILLQFPAISAFEWHPFSLTLCPTEGSPVFSVHIRVCGDWSGRLQKLLFGDSTGEGEECKILMKDIHPKKIKLNLDGPFSSPMEDTTQYRLVLCVAGGIGITPFASFLNDFRTNEKYRKRFRRLYLIWTTKVVRAIGWFAELIHCLHKELWDFNRPDILDVRFHFTTMDKNLCKELPDSCQEYVRKRLTYGRPIWKDLFNEIVSCHPGRKVGVFACGPKPLTRAIKISCWRKYPQNTKFEFHQEVY